MATPGQAPGEPLAAERRDGSAPPESGPGRPPAAAKSAGTLEDVSPPAEGIVESISCDDPDDAAGPTDWDPFKKHAGSGFAGPRQCPEAHADGHAPGRAGAAGHAQRHPARPLAWNGFFPITEDWYGPD